MALDPIPSGPIPYHYLPGSDVGTESPEIAEGADARFPVFDGSSADKSLPTASRPDDFDKQPNQIKIDDFLSWHSSYQLEYIKKFGAPSANAGKEIGIPPATATIMLATDGSRTYVVQKLDKATISKMPLADQQRLATFSTFYSKNTTTGVETGQAINLGLTTDKTVVQAALTAQKTAITNNTNVPAADKQVFLDQIANIQKQLDAMAIFSPIDVGNLVNDLKERFTRVDAFAGSWTETTKSFTKDGNTVTYTDGVVSLDGGQAIRNGYTLFMTQEKQILALQNKRLEIAGLKDPTGDPLPSSIDVPTLVYMLQLNYNLNDEAKMAIQTEEINQTNALLKTYAEMQSAVNETVKAFNPTKQEEARSVYNYNDGKDKDDDDATRATTALSQHKILSMFEDALGSVQHPIEKLKGITRAKQDMFENNTNYINKWTKSTWDTFGSQLSDRVTLINQESQIKMNNVNSLDKQKNRHFDLANNALSKMSEILQNIARSS